MKAKRLIAVISAMSLGIGAIAPLTAVFAAEETEYATREYVVSEFVQSVGRNNLTINSAQMDNLLSAFSDSGEIDEDYRADIARAKAYSIVAGYEDGTLKPQENVRRIEAMVMLARCMPELEETSELIEFTDVPDWAKDDMDRLTKAGLVYGYGDGTLGADDNITAEQVKLLTDRSDEALNTVAVSESFYGYINNKIFRNYDTSKESVIDAIHGVVIQQANSWSYFSDISEKINNDEDEILTKLINGEIEYEQDSAEQRVYDLYDCIKHVEEDNDIDEAVFLEYRRKILDAKTPEEFLTAVTDIYRETGVSLLLSSEADLEPDTNTVYPTVSFTAPDDYASIAFDKATESKYGRGYKELFAKYIKMIDSSFSDNDINAAYKLQQDILAKCDFTQLYAISRSIRTIMDENYTEEMYEADMEAIAKQHPEFNGEESLTDLVTYSTEEITDMNKGFDVVSVLSDVGFTNFDHVLMDNNAAEVIGEIQINKSNLDAYKINAVYMLGNMMDFAPTEAEYNAKNAASEFALSAIMGYETPQDDMYDMDLEDLTEEEDAEEEGYDPSIISTINSLLSNDIGLIYCDYYYDDEISEVIADMIDQIWNAYLGRFDANDWLDEETKEKAKNKIYNMIAVIGYPDNYDFPEIVSRENGGTYFKNLLNIYKDALNTNIRSCADQEFIRTMLIMPPDTVNACYIPSLNIMNIPAGILNAPIYDTEASYAANLGAIGMIIGHEIGHAFDAKGAQYDENGCLKNWWTDETAEKFDEIKQYFIDYYSNFEVMDGVVQDSAVTITENMADFAGMTVVMDIIGDNPEAQREALEAYAKLWARIGSASVIGSDYYLQDVHSSNQVRVNAIVASLDCFYDLYDISEDDPMYVAPDKRLKLW